MTILSLSLFVNDFPLSELSSFTFFPLEIVPFTIVFLIIRSSSSIVKSHLLTFLFFGKMRLLRLMFCTAFLFGLVTLTLDLFLLSLPHLLLLDSLLDVTLYSLLLLAH